MLPDQSEHAYGILVHTMADDDGEAYFGLQEEEEEDTKPDAEAVRVRSLGFECSLWRITHTMIGFQGKASAQRSPSMPCYIHNVARHCPSLPLYFFASILRSIKVNALLESLPKQ